MASADLPASIIPVHALAGKPVPFSDVLRYRTCRLPYEFSHDLLCSHCRRCRHRVLFGLTHQRGRGPGEHLQQDVPVWQASTSLLSVQSLGEAADYLGAVSRNEQEKHGSKGNGFGASFIIGGQIAGARHRIMRVYPEGNHITSSRDTPYLQIGESKYGKPILDRILSRDLDLDTCALCALVSMDSTMRSNLSVGPPIETLIYRAESLALEEPLRFDEDSEFLREVKRNWDLRLKEAFRQMPPFAWASTWDRNARDH